MVSEAFRTRREDTDSAEWALGSACWLWTHALVTIEVFTEEH